MSVQWILIYTMDEGQVRRAYGPLDENVAMKLRAALWDYDERVESVDMVAFEHPGMRAVAAHPDWEQCKTDVTGQGDRCADFNGHALECEA